MALLAVMASVSGCAGQWPLRRPQRDLFLPEAVTPDPLRVPHPSIADYSHQLRQGTLTVAIDLLNPEQAKDAFGLDLAQRGIQPVLVGLRNDSDQAYEVRKADFGLKVVPASRLGALECPHPVRRAAAYVKWGVLLVPGLVFESVIEPSTGFDFPIMHEASRHPSWPGCRDIRQMFVSEELADGALLPGQARSGVVFLRGVALDSALTLTLRRPQTQDTLALVLPTPASTVSQLRVDPKPASAVWPLALKSAQGIASWRVVSADPKTGVIRIQKRSELSRWAPPRPVTVTVRPLDGSRTQTTAESPLREPLSTSMGTSSLTVDHFFRVLAEKLNPPALRTTSPAGLSGYEGPVDG